MIIINSIEISNFRSIVKFHQAISPNHLNIIVGQNDIGKSNILKALNLFFNSETEIGVPFRFSDDFSKHAITPDKKAQEITIKIRFKTPTRFADSEDLVWTKVWRKNGLHNETIKKSSGRIPSKRGAMQWLKKIKYKYIPAVRGSEYFNHLMGELHDALSEINPEAFNDSSERFIEGLKSQVELLTQNISRELGYSSQIGMPNNFKSLFSTLDFSLDKGGNIISLNKRGDGIKAQHIPVILKFIANHYKSITGRGIINPDTIWGFEEPENNMEMTNAFKLAKIFAGFSDDLQIFINTHSPAFYSLAKEYKDKTALYLAEFDMEKKSTLLSNVDIDNIHILDKEIGMLPIITEHIKDEVQKRQEFEKKAEELSKLRSDTKYLVLSEDSDLTYVKKLFEIQGFDSAITEFVSYDSRSNLLAAMQSCKINLLDRPDLTDIIFHRDRDIYEDDEYDKGRVEKRLVDLNKKGAIRYHLFVTDGYDVESYFINAQHISALYPDVSVEIAQQLIDEATDETRTKSLDKLFARIEFSRTEFEERKELIKFSYSNCIDELTNLYEGNKERYRYGKTTLGVLIGKLQPGRGRINLLQNTDKIQIPLLKNIVENP